MLAIRLQRRGRTNLVQYRVIVQDRRFSPAGGKVVYNLGAYDPHTKTAQLDTAKAADYLAKGAQPSPRVAMILKEAGVKLPKWVAKPLKFKKSIRHPEKLRRNRPPEATPPVKPAEEAVVTAEVTPVELDSPTEPATDDATPVEPVVATETTEEPVSAEPTVVEERAQVETNPEPTEPAEQATPAEDKPPQPAAEEPAETTNNT